MDPNDCLGKYTVRLLSGYCTTAGLATVGRKADLVQRLVEFYTAHPEQVPADIRAKFPAFMPLGRPDAPPPVQINDALIQQLSALLDAKLAPQSEALKTLEARIAALEANPGQGEEDGVILPSYAPSVPAAAPAPAYDILPRSLHRFVAPTVLKSVLENTFEIKDLWKLDPLRVNETRAGNANAQAAGSSVMDAIRTSMFPDAEADDARVRSRYTSLTTILRPWIVYVQLRELVRPGISVYLLSHANHLLSLADKWKNSFPAVLAYHLEVAGSRINAGDQLPKEAWLESDLQVITNVVIPMAQKTAASVSIPNQPSKSGSPAWSKDSVGSANSKLGCRNYNAKQPCARWPCSYRHACSACGADGHPAGDASCKK